MKYGFIITIVVAFSAAFAVLTAASRSGPKTDSDNSAGDAASKKIDQIVCTLSAIDWKDRQGVLRELSKGVIERKELEDGFAWGFPADAKWLTAITEVVALERKCCRFLSFSIVVEPDDGPIWLEIGGAEGAKEFLREQLGF